MSTVLASAADERYGFWLLNMVGSVNANSRGLFDRIVLYDLGLSSFQRRLAENIRGVEVRSVPPFVPHWRECFTWKPWIWTHLEADDVLYLDAGVTVLRPLQEPLTQLREHGYFLVSQGNPLTDIVPREYYELFGLQQDLTGREYAAAGLLGFRTSGSFFDTVLTPTYEDALRGLGLGYSADEVPKDSGAIVRDCRRFRHDQTLLNIHLVSAFPDAELNDVYRFGGWTTPRDHPAQVLWNHRRRGDFRYLVAVPYAAPVWLAAKLWGIGFRWRWWAKNHSWLFRPATYLRKARKVVAAPFAR